MLYTCTFELPKRVHVFPQSTNHHIVHYNSVGATDRAVGGDRGCDPYIVESDGLAIHILH